MNSWVLTSILVQVTITVSRAQNSGQEVDQEDGFIRDRGGSIADTGELFARHGRRGPEKYVGGRALSQGLPSGQPQVPRLPDQPSAHRQRQQPGAGDAEELNFLKKKVGQREGSLTVAVVLKCIMEFI